MINPIFGWWAPKIIHSSINQSCKLPQNWLRLIFGWNLTKYLLKKSTKDTRIISSLTKQYISWPKSRKTKFFGASTKWVTIWKFVRVTPPTPHLYNKSMTNLKDIFLWSATRHCSQKEKERQKNRKENNNLNDLCVINKPNITEKNWKLIIPKRNQFDI